MKNFIVMFAAMVAMVLLAGSCKSDWWDDEKDYEMTFNLYSEGGMEGKDVIVWLNGLPEPSSCEVTESDIYELNSEDSYTQVDGWKAMIDGFEFEAGEKYYLEESNKLLIKGLAAGEYAYFLTLQHKTSSKSQVVKFTVHPNLN